MDVQCPNCKNIQSYSGTLVKGKRRTTRCNNKKCKKSFDVRKNFYQEKTTEDNEDKKESIPPQNASQTFIDDPNELLMSVAMRELNKSTPEVRWASILLQMLDKTKQLETITKSDLQSKLKQYSSTELINLRKRLIES